MSKYKVGDSVRTIKDRDYCGEKVFPVGTIGTIADVLDDSNLPYEIESEGESWYYSEDMFEPVKDYNQGLNDAWELAKRINCYKSDGGLSQRELKEIFGTFDCCKTMNLSYKEALAKLKAYEERIEVGDVVTYAGEKCVVLDKRGSKLVVLMEEGVYEWYECDVEKTDKHIDIKSILEQIGE